MTCFFSWQSDDMDLYLKYKFHTILVGNTFNFDVIRRIKMENKYSKKAQEYKNEKEKLVNYDYKTSFNF